MERLVTRFKRDATVCDGTNCAGVEADNRLTTQTDLARGKLATLACGLTISSSSDTAFSAICTQKRQDPPCASLIVEVPIIHLTVEPK